MEESGAQDNADDEYMTMDADTWLEQDDTYENGDTLGVDLEGKEDPRGRESGHDSRVERIKELETEGVVTKTPAGKTRNTTNSNTPQPPIQSLPNRYITIRRPPINANRRPAERHSRQNALLKCTTVCLVLLSFLLVGGLIGLSHYYVRLSVDCMRMREKMETLLDEKHKLEAKLDTLLNLSKSLYQISMKTENNCFSEMDLFILNHDVLEEQMKSKRWFTLNQRIPGNRSSGISYLCNIAK